MSPTLKFRLVWFHFYLVWNVANTSFHRVQNLFDKCWTCHHCFLQYMSSFWKVPGGSMITLVFELSSCIGLNGIILLTLPMDSQVIGWELVIPSTSPNNVQRDSSLKLSPWFLSIAERKLLADRICHSHTPPMLLAMGGLHFQLIHSPPNSIKKSLILFSSISPSAFFSSMLAPTKLAPLSLRIILTFPLLLIKRLSAWMKPSVVKFLVTLMCTDLLDKHVNMASYLYWIFPPSLTRNGPNMSIPQKVKGGSSESLSAGRFPILCRHIFPCSFLHSTHLDMTYLTALVQLIIQYPWLRISFIVTPWPAWATFSWWSLMMACVMWPSLGNKDASIDHLSWPY